MLYLTNTSYLQSHRWTGAGAASVQPQVVGRNFKLATHAMVGNRTRMHE